ncbi:PNOC protein, partial [Rhabdornis inornatus]|nr:PNOC protein [Rhabdornis inornatus]
LLLLCLFARARGDCRDDCVHCDRLLYRDGFDVLVSQAVPRATWELCAAAGRAAPRPRHLSARRWPQTAAAEPAAPGAFPQPRREEEEEEEEDIWRRLGAGRAAKGVQKRYGGFIGVRKSARKWNNQKRFSEFLKQYLGMAPRSSEYGPGAGAGQNNEI